jgi:hypothetical protein
MSDSIAFAATLKPTDTTAATSNSGKYEVTSGGRVRYVINDADHIVWIVYASPRHPKDTDR